MNKVDIADGSTAPIEYKTAAEYRTVRVTPEKAEAASRVLANRARLASTR